MHLKHYTYRFDNVFSTHSRMDPILERQVMVSLYLAHHFYKRQWFRFNEVAKLTGVRKSSLQRILPRLESRHWIQSWRGESFDDNEPAMAIFHLQPRSFLPVEIVNEYNFRIQNLKRHVQYQTFPDLMFHKQEQTYAEAIKEKNQRKNMPFKGKARSWHLAVASTMPRRYTFYQVIMFPFIHKVIFPYGKKILVHYGAIYSTVPEGTKRMWYNAAKEVIEVFERSNRGGKAFQDQNNEKIYHRSREMSATKS